MKDNIRTAALKYHEYPIPGKIGVVSLKPTESQEDLALCYTPGVAEPVIEIAKNPATAYQYTNKGNLVAIISNGTAVLGLGNVGAIASKPVMEGKGVLFKRFSGIDAFDIEIDCTDPDKLVETIIRISPTFGGINLEDIKAPECFYIEDELKKRMTIPVFHDDQHGTAIVVAAGLLNALEIQQKKLSKAKIVCVGAGAAGIATMKLLLKLGASKNNLLMVDSKGVINTKRNNLNPYKQCFAIETPNETLVDALKDANVFIGVSGPSILTPAMLTSMSSAPIVFALSNPTPEILPEIAHKECENIIMATGRSDYPNQVNNALCFPYIFLGALQSKASQINEAMQLAAVYAIKELAKESIPQEVKIAYPQEKNLEFGPEYILPKLLDPRLREKVSSAVARAAVSSGVTKI